jgi:hypothetical protein
MQTMMKVLNDSPQYHQQIQNKNEQFRICNRGVVPASDFEDAFLYHARGIKCTMWMSEGPYSSLPQRIYTIVREPIQHTLSMYFHCAESKDHRKKAQYMPGSLDEWLEAWVDIKKKNDTKVNNKNRRPLKLGQHRDPRYKCYNPINFQSSWTEYYPGQGREMAKADLMARYDVLGDNSQMDKTVCLICKACYCSIGIDC